MSSIFKSNKTKENITDTVSVIKSIIPHELWGINQFKREQTKLVSLYTKNADLTRKRQELDLELANIQDRKKSVNSKYSKEVDDYLANLGREKEVKVNEFKSRKLELKNEKDKKISIRVKELRSYSDEINDKFNKEQTINLNKYKKMITYIDKVLGKYEVKIEGNLDKLNIGNIEESELYEVVDDLDYYIEETLNQHISHEKLTNKVRDLDKKSSIIAAISATVATILFTPVVLVGATVWVGSLANSNKKAQAEVLKYIEQLLRIKSHCEGEFEYWKNKPRPDTSDINEEMKKVCASVETEYKNDLENLLRMESEWKTSFEARSKQENINKIIESKSSEIDSLDMTHTKKMEILKINYDRAEKEYKEALEKFKESNKLSEILSNDNIKIRKAVKEIKGNISDYIRYRNLLKLDYDYEIKPGDKLIDISRKRYTQELYENVFLKLKLKIEQWEAEGKTEEFWKKAYNEALERENIYYLLNTSNLYLGQVQQDAKYSTLKEDEKCMATGWGNNSVLFVYRNEKEELVLINYIKNLVYQMLSFTSPDAIEVNIVNKDMDTKFNDITIDTLTYDKFGKPQKNPLYVTNYSGGEVDNLLENQKNLIVQRQRKELVGGETISGVIKEKRKQGSKSPKFILNILHREGIDSGFLKFNENSPETGIINFCLLPYDSIMQEDTSNSNKNSKTKVEKIIESTKEKLKKTPILVEYLQEIGEDSHTFSIHNKNEQEYKVVKYKELSPAQITNYSNFFKERYLADLTGKVSYGIDEFVLDIVGDKFYTENADKGIKLYPGYPDGDKSQRIPVILDEQDMPHMFLGGTTGGGKSVTLATINAIIKVMYPPSEVDIIYFDFKVVEVAVHASPYKWPNASVLSGSKNPEYLMSLLKELLEIMENRYADMESLQMNSFSSYRNYLRKLKQSFIDKGDMERADKVIVPPRLLVIIDEFAQGFQIDDDVTEIMKDTITKLLQLGRAAGLNLLALSQDPGTSVPENVMGLFKVRACTKATPSVSRDVMRNDFCALPENQFLGFLGVNSSGTGDPEANVRYLVPFTSEQDTQLYTKMVTDLLPVYSEESRDATIFSEGSPLTLKQLHEYLDNNPPSSRELILGEPVKYQKEFKLRGINLKTDDKQNISFATTDRERKLDFIRTLAESINRDETAKVSVYFSKEEYEDIDLRKTFNTHVFYDEEDDSAPVITSMKTYDKNEEATGERVLQGVWVYNDINMMIDARRKKYKETGIRDTTPIYLIVIDPDVSLDIVTDYVWGKAVVPVFNEMNRWGIYMIQISSSMYFLEKEPEYIGYLIGTRLGSAASMNKKFKNLDNKFTKLSNELDDVNSFQFKLPSLKEREKKPWED